MQNQHPLLGNVTTTVDGYWNNMRGVGDGTTQKENQEWQL